MKFFEWLGGSSEQQTSNQQMQPKVLYPEMGGADWNKVCRACDPRGEGICSYHANAFQKEIKKMDRRKRS